MELTIPADMIGGGVDDVVFFVDVNDTDYFPAFFAADWSTATSYNLPVSTVDPANKQAALVFSRTSEAQLGTKAYTTLFQKVQSQVSLSGIDHDVIFADDLTNLEKIIGYSALVFPYKAFVEADQYQAIFDNLRLAVHMYGTGVVASENFLTNTPGSALSQPYRGMWEILGLNIIGAQSGDLSIVVSDSSVPVLSGYAAGSTLLEYPAAFYNHYTVPQKSLVL